MKKKIQKTAPPFLFKEKLKMVYEKYWPFLFGKVINKNILIILAFKFNIV